jgi:hypothetical protein
LATTNTKLRSQQWGSLYFLTSLSKKKKKITNAFTIGTGTKPKKMKYLFKHVFFDKTICIIPDQNK